jgi:hypothetical protein
MVATAKNVGGYDGGGGKRPRLNAIFVTSRKEFFIIIIIFMYLCLLILF